MDDDGKETLTFLKHTPVPVSVMSGFFCLRTPGIRMERQRRDHEIFITDVSGGESESAFGTVFDLRVAYFPVEDMVSTHGGKP